MTMENSSESGWQRSDSSRGFNASAVSDRNPRLFRASRIRSSSDASHDSGFIPGGKERERNVFTNRDVRERSTSVSAVCKDEIAVHPVVCGVDWTDISLRQWLDNPERSVDAVECLHVFTQIVQIVELAHSQGIVVHNVRPSCFVISSFNSVSFLESSSCSDSGSDSLGDGSNSQTAEFKGSSSLLPRESHQQSSQFRRENSLRGIDPRSLYPTRNSFEAGSDVEQVEEKKQSFPMKQILLLESNWYTSPEEVGGAPSSCASDIYRLGVLLFELFCTFSSSEEKSSTMSSLRHRVLPPQLLLKWPKEASFCLWLLHPDPSSRPKMSDLLQSEFLNEPRNNIEERQAAIDLQERIEEQELLLEFLTLIQQRKQVAADNLQDTISFISSDIEEASKKQSIICKKGRLCPEVGRDPSSGAPLMEAVENEDSGCSGSRKRSRQGLHSYNAEKADDQLLEDQSSKASAGNRGCILLKSCRLMKNFKKLETAYFLTRRRAIKQSGKSSACHPPISAIGRGSITSNERNSNNNFPWNVQSSEERQSGWINSFFEGLCKYLSFSKLQVKADLKQGDLINSSNLVCSLSFDRDGELFATAGVNKKIKIFEYHRILNEDRDIHYPVVELASRSKLSSICWNSYIKSQIASSNFEGVVQVWDVTRSQVYMEMREHERRVWSVDFSLADPMMLASGSDDGSVKLWNINQAILLLHLVDVSFETTRGKGVVVLPCGSRKPAKPFKLELAIYSSLQDARPRTLVALWKANMEEPNFNQPDPAVIISDIAAKSRIKLAPTKESDKQQLQWFCNACKGIPQVAHLNFPFNAQTPVVPATAPSSVEDLELAMALSASIQSAAMEARPPYVDVNPGSQENVSSSSHGGSGTPAAPAPPFGKSSGNKLQEVGPSGIPAVIQTMPEIPPPVSIPSAPPVENAVADDGPIHYPSIDSSSVEVSSPLVANLPAKADERKDDTGSSSCVICLDAPVEGACIPCGHMAGCMSCLNEIKSKKWGCPVCRAKIDQIIRLYTV